jgi:predicted permease
MFLPSLRRLFRLPRYTAESAGTDVDSELAFHLQMRVDELRALGMPEEEARREALRRFGDMAEARASLVRRGGRQVRRRRWTGWLLDLGQDIGFAVRGLRRRQGFATVAVATIGLGLGLTTTVLAVVNRLILHPFPYPDAERLAFVALASDETRIQISPTLDMLGAWSRSRQNQAWIAGYNSEQLLLEAGEIAELVQTKSVTPDLLRQLGARIALGRGFQTADTAAAAPLVTLLSWNTWQRRYGGAPDVLGKTVRINGKVAVIAGVVGQGFDLTPLDDAARAEFWLPLGGRGASAGQSASILLLRKPGVSIAQTTAALQATLKSSGISSEMLKEFAPRAMDSNSRRDHGREKTLWLLTFAVAMVLAVACANVAALLLGQSAIRAQEFGVRAALGAGRGRVIRQLITESTVLGSLGGIAGLGIAALALWITRISRPDNLLALDDVSIEPRVMLFALGATLIVAMLFGAAPAWAAARGDAAASMLGRIRRTFDTRFGRSLRGMLVVGQLAGSLVLVSGAGLFLRSFLRDRNLPIGFEPRGLGWVQLDVPRDQVPVAAVRAALVHEAAAAIRALPGIDEIGLSSDPPLGYGIMQGEFLIEGQPVPDKEAKALIPMRVVDGGYFSTIGMRLDAGRLPDPSPNSREIVMDSWSARKFFPRGNAVGARVRYGRKDAEYHTIVGLVAEQRQLLGGFEDMPSLYVPMTAEDYVGTFNLRGHGAGFLDKVSAAIRKVDPRIRIRSVVTAQSALDERLAPQKFTMTVVTGFAALALLLAAVGLYGVIALAVSQRTYEIGVRIALGAAPGGVRLMVLREGLARIGIGLGLGFGLILALGRILKSLIAGTPVWDPAVWTAGAAVLAAAGLLACWVPARRASRIDPMIALRSD